MEKMTESCWVDHFACAQSLKEYLNYITSNLMVHVKNVSGTSGPVQVSHVRSRYLEDGE